MAIRILHLVRHGQYETENGERLTDLGRAQAEIIAGRLASMPLNRVLCSTAPRARETAAPIWRALPKTKRRPWSLLREAIPTCSRYPLLRPLERPEDHWARDLAKLDTICERLLEPPDRDREDAVVFHGNMLRALVCRALDLPVEAWWEMQIHHCSLTTLKIDPRRNRLIRFNDVGHLPSSLQTEW